MFPWLHADPDAPSLWRDLKSGDAGWLPRTGLSLAAAGGLLAIGLGGLGLLELVVNMSDGMAVAGLGLAAAAWCVSLYFIWATFGRAWKVLKTVFAILTVWSSAIPLGLLIDDLPGDGDFFIGAIIVAAIGATMFLVSTLGYRRGGGRALMLRDGVIDVRCPECGYSLVGITHCHCPECGTSYTIDELIRRQNYRATLPRPPSASCPQAPAACVEAPPALPEAGAGQPDMPPA